MAKFTSKKDIPFCSKIIVAPDKSISHRSLIFSALANGTSKIFNLLEGQDVLCTAAALRQMGVLIEKKKDHWQVIGSGIAGLTEPRSILEMGNSGTSTRLLAGLVAPYNFTSFFSGDDSLRKRPMARIFGPIRAFGAEVVSRQGSLLPFAIVGTSCPLPIEYHMKIASAQVKSSILLAAMNTKGTTTIIEPEKCRDHTEIMMRHFGLRVLCETRDGVNKIRYSGMQEFGAQDLTIPADISSASFFIVAALLVKGSKILLPSVGVNPLRSGIIKTLQEMGGKILLKNQREVVGEIVADIEVEHSDLVGVEVPASRAASMIDEYPILSIACAHAKGVSTLHGLAELKAKESNRLEMISKNLEKCGCEVKTGIDSLEIKGGIKMPKHEVEVFTAMDHRIAMSFLIMGLTLENGLSIDDDTMIKTSFPSFEEILQEVL